MVPANSLFALLTLAVSFTGVSAGPVPTSSIATLPFKRSLRLSSFLDIVKADQARARALKSTSGGANNGDAPISIPATNNAVTYTTEIGVGTPPTQYTLLIDTGSSNTWIGANKTYTRTISSVKTANNVSVTYGSGSFNGTEYTDTVTLSPELIITKQSIGVASNSTGFDGVDGILGIGPTDLTTDTLSPDTNSTVPAVTDNLFSQKTISTETIGISFNPTNTEYQTNGELTFGGCDSTKFTGEITYTPITSTSPANQYWGINQTITYGDGTPIFSSSTAGIVDTGTTLLLLATDAFQAYGNATGGVFNQTTGLFQLTLGQYSNLESLYFKIGSSTFELPPNGQIFPRSLNSFFGGDADHVYLIVGDTGTPSGQGLDFLNGYTFLERFYSEYDTTNKRVGLATTPFTNATTN
ncbi:aspartic proteinase [Athelia psychrophila]|uniref:Aspartic proteinase n=1 Tax=Athelia psychrophila TaxID=1759441 RepID=A0A166DLP6_9AGAM|nr:aspartic proteinase [Fibularhizoctonia sp. CBS 109695]